MVICLERGADLHMSQLMPLPLTVSCCSKIQIGLPYWYRLTWVVPYKGPLNGCVCVVWQKQLRRYPRGVFLFSLLLGTAVLFTLMAYNLTWFLAWSLC